MGLDKLSHSDENKQHSQDAPSSAQMEAYTFSKGMSTSLFRFDTNQSGFVTRDEIAHAPGRLAPFSGFLCAHYDDMTKLSTDRAFGKEPGISVGDLSSLDWCSKHGTGFGSSLIMGVGNTGLRHIGLGLLAAGLAVGLFSRNASLGRMAVVGLTTGLGVTELSSTFDWMLNCKPSMDRVLNDLGQAH